MTMLRATLQTTLEEFQKKVGETPHVYFDPPETVKMVYPCFVYHFVEYVDIFSNDELYLRFERYTVTYITKKADPELPRAMSALSGFEFDRHYTSDNLHHFMFVANSRMYNQPPEVDLRPEAASFLGGNNGIHDFMG